MISEDISLQIFVLLEFFFIFLHSVPYLTCTRDVRYQGHSVCLRRKLLKNIGFQQSHSKCCPSLADLDRIACPEEYDWELSGFRDTFGISLDTRILVLTINVKKRAPLA